jgi:CheY-like chemotaxis protein
MNLIENTKFKSVVIVDDNEIDVYINKRMLEYSKLINNADVFSFTDSLEAFDKLTKNYLPLKSPTLLILDLSMPNFSGFDFMEKLKGFPEILTKMSVVVLTSTRSEKEAQKCLNYDFVIKFVSKPITINDITAVML